MVLRGTDHDVIQYRNCVEQRIDRRRTDTRFQTVALIQLLQPGSLLPSSFHPSPRHLIR